VALTFNQVPASVYEPVTKADRSVQISCQVSIKSIHSVHGLYLCSVTHCIGTKLALCGTEADLSLSLSLSLSLDISQAYSHCSVKPVKFRPKATSEVESINSSSRYLRRNKKPSCLPASVVLLVASQ